MMSENYNDKNSDSSKPVWTKQEDNGNAEELIQQLTDLQKTYEETRDARRAALNLMEDAILSKEALQRSEEKYRTKLEQDVRDRTAELNASKDFLQATIDSSLDVIQVFKAIRNKEGKIIDFIWIMNNKKGIEQNGDVTGKSLLRKNPGVINTGIFNKMVQAVETGVPVESEQFYNYEQFNGWFYQAIVKSGDGVVMTTRDITQQKSTEREIKESKELLQATMNSSMDMIQVFEAVRNEQHEIIDFKWILNNQTSEKIYGNIIGKSLLENNPGVVEIGIFDTFKKVVETGIPDQTERHYVHEQFNGWFYQSTVKLGDGVATTTADITERKKAEQEILRLKDEIARRATDKYYSLFNSIDEGFHIIELIYDNAGKAIDFRFLETNKSFERHTGLKNVAGKLGSEIAPNTEDYWFEAYEKVAKTGEPVRFENYNQFTRRWYSAYAFHVPNESSAHVAVLFNDITQRKQAEAQQAFSLKLSDALRALNDPVKIQEVVTNETLNYFKADRCYYCEIEGEYSIIRRDAFCGNLPSVSGRYPLSSFAIFKSVIDAGRPFIVNNVHTTDLVDESLKEICIQLKVISFIDVPVMKEGKVIGVLCLVQSEPRNWTDIEVQLAEETAERTWAAVERARAEEAVRKSEEQLKQLNILLEQKVEERTKEVKEQSRFISNITDTVPDMISVTELPSRKVNYINKKTSSAQGFDPDAMTKLPYEKLREMIHKDDRAQLDNYYNSFMNGSDDEIVTAEYRAKNIKGNWLWFKVRGIVFQRDESGKVTHILNIIQNITEQKNAEEKITELNKELFSKNRELETANSELRTFSSVAATDYKETLKHLYTLFEFIVSNDARNLSNTGKANIRRAQSAIQKMKLLTDDILAYTEIQTEISEIKTVSFAEIFDVVLQKLNKKIEETNTVIKLSDGVQKIKGYPNLLSLMFYHLLDNAIKFRKTDTSPVVEIRYSKIAGTNINADATTYFVVSITDNGIGVESLEKEKLFTMFYKGDKTKYKGSGIGLAICKKIMDLHDGFIAAEPSAETGGTTVNCFFPLEDAHW